MFGNLSKVVAVVSVFYFAIPNDSNAQLHGSKEGKGSAQLKAATGEKQFRRETTGTGYCDDMRKS